jgi:hypothetical protein
MPLRAALNVGEAMTHKYGGVTAPECRRESQDAFVRESVE